MKVPKLPKKGRELNLKFKSRLEHQTSGSKEISKKEVKETRRIETVTSEEGAKHDVLIFTAYVDYFGRLNFNIAPSNKEKSGSSMY